MKIYFEEIKLERTENSAASKYAVFIAFIIAIIFWIANFYYGLSLDVVERGLFGDMFGAVNAAFSGFAFVGVIYAIYLQRHEISIAKREIEYTKNILSDQQEQLRLQNRETKKQAFESTYFQMVHLFIDLTNQIDLQRQLNNTQIITKGKDVFPVFLKRFRKKYNTIEKDLYGGHNFEKSYQNFYEEHNTELGHYFRMLYNIINFIDGSDVENKNFYAKILRAQLSDSEIAILFYNGLSQNGSEKFKPLIERYGLLKNLNDQDVFDDELKGRYQSSAFGNSHKGTKPIRL